MADVSRGDWQCPNEQCFNHTNFPNAYVYGSSVNCKKCGTGKLAQQAGDWCCPNAGCLNQMHCLFSDELTCPRCGTPKPTAGVGGRGAGAGMMGMGMQAPMGMGMQAPMGKGMGPGGVSQPREGDWHCANPSCKNHTANVVYSSKSSCPICGMAKPDSPVMATASGGNQFGGTQFAGTQFAGNQFAGNQFAGAQFANQFFGNQFAAGQLGTPAAPNARPGDWNCPNPQCKNHVNNVVYGSKDHCPLCNMPKPEAGAYVSGGGGGGGQRPVPNQRPGDWHCPSPYCKNHTDNIIFASKDRCPLCNTGRPGLDGRERSRSPR